MAMEIVTSMVMGLTTTRECKAMNTDDENGNHDKRFNMHESGRTMVVKACRTTDNVTNSDKFGKNTVNDTNH